MHDFLDSKKKKRLTKQQKNNIFLHNQKQSNNRFIDQTTVFSVQFGTNNSARFAPEHAIVAMYSYKVKKKTKV